MIGVTGTSQETESLYTPLDGQWQTPRGNWVRRRAESLTSRAVGESRGFVASLRCDRDGNKEGHGECVLPQGVGEICRGLRHLADSESRWMIPLAWR